MFHRFCLVVTALCLVGGTARGDVVLQLLLNQPVGDHHEWLYRANVLLGSTFEAGDSIVLPDFAGFISAAPPPDFTVETALTGLYPAEASIPDDPLLPNVRFTYTGDLILGPELIGYFTLSSAYDTAIVRDYVGTDTNFAGGKEWNVGQAFMPAAVPEPGTCILAGLGGLLICVYFRRRQ